MGPTTATNLKIFGTVLATLAVYTWVASAIPQLESEVPEEVSFSAEVTPEELSSAGEELFDGAGACTTCHGTGTRAPNLREAHEGEGIIGERCGERVEGMSCKEYLYESMVQPNEYLVEGFPPSMPPQDRILTSNQIWALIAYLQSLGGEVTVTAEDLESEPAGGGGETAAEEPAGSDEGSPDAMALMQQNACLGCHTLGDQGMEVGPTFDGIGSERSEEYLRRAIVDPEADIPDGYEDVAGNMPPNFGDILTEAEIDALVGFLASQQ